MSFEEQKNRFLLLDRWALSDMGLQVMQAFSAEMLLFKEILHGDSLLQLGGANNSLCLKLRYAHKWTVASYPNAHSDLISFFDELALDRNSVDCVVVPLVLEPLANKEDVLDEIDRILKPMGHVIFFGVNPLSPWGLWLRFGHHGCYGNVKCKLKSVLALKLAMLHRGYVQCYLSNFYYIPPVRTQKWIKRFEIFNAIGKMISPMPAGFYCFVAQKQEENWIARPILAPNKQFVPATPPLQPSS